MNNINEIMVQTCPSCNSMAELYTAYEVNENNFPMFITECLSCLATFDLIAFHRYQMVVNRFFVISNAFVM